MRFAVKSGLKHLGTGTHYGIVVLSLLMAIALGLKMFGHDILDEILFIKTAHGQTVAQPKNIDSAGRDLSRVLETHAKRFLERHLKPEDFDIIIKASEKSPKNKDLPYVPEVLGTKPYDSLSIEDLTALVGKLEITVMLLPSFKATSKKQIEAILSQRLNFDSARGDTITFATLGFEVKNPTQELEKSIAKLEAEAKDYKNKLDDLTQDRAKVGKELEQKKADLEQKNADLQKLRLESSRESLTPQQILTIALAIAAAFIFASIFVGLSLRSGAKSMSTAVAAIGQNVNIFGDKISDSLGSNRVMTAGTLDARTVKSIGNTDVASPVRTLSTGQGISLESMQARIMALHNELSGTLSEVTEGLVIVHIGRLLESGPSVSRAVATLELLGEAKARELFLKLGEEHQTTISDFMRSGRFEQPKGELMIEAGEELKTKLLGEMFGTTRGQRNEKVAMRLLQLRSDDIASALKNLSTDGLSRILYYFEPKRLGSFLAFLKQQNPDQYTRALKALCKVPEIEGQSQLDQELIPALDEQINSNKDDHQRHYFGWYKALADSVGEDLVDELAKELSTGNARLERFVNEQIITFGTIYKLDPALRTEIIQGLQNRELGALIYGLKEKERTDTLQVLDTRRRELVSEEMERLAAKGQWQATEGHKAARKRMIVQMQNLQSQGLLSFAKNPGHTGDQTTNASDDVMSAA